MRGRYRFGEPSESPFLQPMHRLFQRQIKPDYTAKRSA